MKKSPARRLLFWTIFALYAAGSVWWTLTIPRDTESLLRAIPGNAVLVSWHDQLAARWPSVSGHPFVLSVVGALQGDHEEWTDLQSDPGFQATLDLVGRDQLVLAYVPHFGMYHEPAWVFAGWIGGQSQRLRWSHRFLDIPGLQRLDDLGGWPVWTWFSTSENGSFRVTVALVEGMIIGTTARDPLAIETVIDSYNGLFPSQAYREDLRDWNRLLIGSGYDDRFWIRSTAWPAVDRYFAELDIADATRMQASIRFFPPGSLAALPESIAIEDLAALWGDETLASSAVGTESLVSALPQGAPNVFGSVFKDVIAGSRADALALSVFGGDLSGRFKGIKVPTIMAALHRTEGGDITDWIQPLVDRWNARYQWGLVPVPVSVGTATVWRIEGTSEGLYGALAPTEQIALTMSGEWMVASSNFKALEALVARRQQQAASPAAWSETLDDAVGSGAGGFLAVDLVRGNEALRLAITAYSLKLLFEDASGSRAQRQKLNETKAWLETLAKLERLTVMVAESDPYVRIDLETGRP